MSNTQRFTSLDYFKCLSSSSDTNDSVGSLSLAQAMDFYFNIENIQISISASGSWYETANPSNTKSFNETGTFDLTPLSFTGGLFSGGSVSYQFYSGIYHGSSVGSAPDIREPIDRVCDLSSLTTAMSGMVLGKVDGLFNESFHEYFNIHTDGVNAGSWRVLYDVHSESFIRDTYDFTVIVSSLSTQSPGAYGSGTASFNGISIPYYVNASCPTGWTISSISGSMSISSSKWTYV